MKKIMSAAILALLTLGVCLHAQRGYDGPKDVILDNHRDLSYYLAIHKTTLGSLARYSDIIGMGLVSQRTNDQFIITIDHALVGCTNGSALVVYGEWDEKRIIELWGGGNNYGRFYPLLFNFPTNQSRIVFAASTNRYDGWWVRMHWHHTEIPEEPEHIRDSLSLNYLNRSWWYVDRDDGLLLTQFTNVLQTVRFDCNWTNYFYLCRDGANSSSNRVREDAFEDMYDICIQATDEQKQFILNDPLVDQKHKDLLQK